MSKLISLIIALALTFLLFTGVEVGIISFVAWCFGFTLGIKQIIGIAAVLVFIQMMFVKVK